MNVGIFAKGLGYFGLINVFIPLLDLFLCGLIAINF